MPKYLIEGETLASIADSIRERASIGQETPFIEKMTPLEMREQIKKLPISGSDATATAEDVLNTKTVYINGEKVQGKIPLIEKEEIVISDKEQTETITQGYVSKEISISISEQEKEQLVPENIRKGVVILGVEGNSQEGTDTSQGNINPEDVLQGKIGYSQNEEIIGSMPNNGDSSFIVSNKDTINIPEGYYSGQGTISIDDATKNNLLTGNIKKGIKILGVTGTCQEGINTSSSSILAPQIANGEKAFNKNGAVYGCAPFKNSRGNSNYICKYADMNHPSIEYCGTYYFVTSAFWRNGQKRYDYGKSIYYYDELFNCWEKFYTSSKELPVNNIAYGKNKYLASIFESNEYIYSEDYGGTLSGQTIPFQDLNGQEIEGYRSGGIVYAFKKFYSINRDGLAFYCSEDGLHWKKVEAILTEEQQQSLMHMSKMFFVGDRIVCSPYHGQDIYGADQLYSLDGIHWTTFGVYTEYNGNVSNELEAIRSIFFAKGKYYINSSYATLETEDFINFKIYYGAGYPLFYYNNYFYMTSGDKGYRNTEFNLSDEEGIETQWDIAFSLSEGYMEVFELESCCSGRKGIMYALYTNGDYISTLSQDGKTWAYGEYIYDVNSDFTIEFMGQEIKISAHYEEQDWEKGLDLIQEIAETNSSNILFSNGDLLIDNKVYFYNSYDNTVSLVINSPDNDEIMMCSFYPYNEKIYFAAISNKGNIYYYDTYGHLIDGQYNLSSLQMKFNDKITYLETEKIDQKAYSALLNSSGFYEFDYTVEGGFVLNKKMNEDFTKAKFINYRKYTVIFGENLGKAILLEYDLENKVWKIPETETEPRFPLIRKDSTIRKIKAAIKYNNKILILDENGEILIGDAPISSTFGIWHQYSILKPEYEWLHLFKKGEIKLYAIGRKYNSISKTYEYIVAEKLSTEDTWIYSFLTDIDILQIIETEIPFGEDKEYLDHINQDGFRIILRDGSSLTKHCYYEFGAS